MEKLVAKTAVKTALIVITLIAVAFVVFNFAFPQHMATFTEGIGNYSLAVKYTSLRYTYTGDVYDLARCVDDCVMADEDENISKYGVELVNHKDFDEVCDFKNYQITHSSFGVLADYKQYICGRVAVAVYDCGSFDDALKIVQKEGVADYTTFRSGIAVLSLAARVYAVKDSGSVDAMLEELNKIAPTEQDEISRLKDVKNRLTNLKISTDRSIDR